MSLEQIHVASELQRFGTDGERRWMQSGAVARMFGIKTDTLAKWRRLGKGPKGWKRVSDTVVVYPVAEVAAFNERLKNGQRCETKGGSECH